MITQIKKENIAYMEIVSQSEIKIINDTSSLYILFCFVVTLISLAILYDKTKKSLILSCITLIGFTVVVLLAYTESMCTSINKYDYKAEITVPEIDSSKYTVLGNTTQKIDVNIQDKLTEEERKAADKTQRFMIIVGVCRCICGALWYILLYRLSIALGSEEEESINNPLVIFGTIISIIYGGGIVYLSAFPFPI